MKISVITVTFNAEESVERTLLSILDQRYPSLEIVVVDGASTDGTMAALKRYSAKIDVLSSEPDRGIYDAMNKAVKKASGDYLLFMNAGDIFSDSQALVRLAGQIDGSQECVVFGAWTVKRRQGPALQRCPDLLRGLFNHQATLYSRSIHAWHGDYACISGLTAADYLFFRTLQSSKRVSFRICQQTIAEIDPFGVSAGLQTYLQRVLVDVLCGHEGRYTGALKIVIHPIYHWIKRTLMRQ